MNRLVGQNDFIYNHFIVQCILPLHAQSFIFIFTDTSSYQNCPCFKLI